MSLFFLFKLGCYWLSVIFLTQWINRLLNRRHYFSAKILPCFAWGWLLYFALYMTGLWAKISVAALSMLFTALAVGSACAGLLSWLYSLRSPLRLRLLRSEIPLDLVSLGGTAAFMLGMMLVGPYLEFPSDPLEHLRRIQSWERVIWTQDVYSVYALRFSYFWSHWLLQDSGITWGERQGLGIFCAVLQGMLFWSFIRVTKQFTSKKTVAWLGAIFSVAFFGKDVFSFYSYYVLASTFTTYLVFLEGLLLLLHCFQQQQFRNLWLLPPLLFFCVQNHAQEALLLLNAGLGLCVLLLLVNDVFTTFSSLSSLHLY